MNSSIIVIIYLLVAMIFACSPSDPNQGTVGQEIMDQNGLASSSITGYSIQDTVYVPVYSDIYSRSRDVRFLLTATLSIRNTSLKDTLIVNTIDYFDTHGELLVSYIDAPISLHPMATIDYVIEEEDETGGSGANFIVVWSAKNKHINPVIQSVMISTSGQQGVAFTTEGVSTRRP